MDVVEQKILLKCRADNHSIIICGFDQVPTTSKTKAIHGCILLRLTKSLLRYGLCVGGAHHLFSLVAHGNWRSHCPGLEYSRDTGEGGREGRGVTVKQMAGK